MKYRLLHIVLLGILKRYVPVAKAYDTALKELSSGMGVNLFIEKIKINSFSGIRINNIKIQYGSLLCEVAEMTIAIKVGKLISMRSLVRSLVVEITRVTCMVEDKGPGASPAEVKRKTNGGSRLHVVDRIRRLLYRQFPDISISDVIIDIGLAKCSLRKIRLQGDIFSFDVVYGKNSVCISGIKRMRLSRLLITAKATSVASSIINFTRASIALTLSHDVGAGRPVAHLRTYCKDIFLNHPVLHDEGISIQKVFLNLQLLLSLPVFEVMDDSFIKLDDWETYFCLSNDLEAKKSVGSFVSNISSILYHPFFSQILDPAVAGTKLTGDLTLCGGFDILMEYRRMNNLKIRVAENTIAMADRSLFNVLDTDNSIPGIEAANGNEVFLKVENLPGLHVATLILCEDPDFFFHNGIDLYYVARAFSATVKNKRVSRGASTITMQLMKNLFLHRRKTISRKVNEVILSLLLENHSSVSKQKILEKYINIIEFGPDLYGIMDACRYYFSKHPDELTVPEFITLTYIIPRPIHFHDALLRKTQQLINNLGVHFDKVCLKLMWNELITVDEYKSFNRRIEFANDLGYIDLPRE